MSSLSLLHQAVARHISLDAGEEEMRQKLLTFLDNGENILWRTYLSGHITASAWVFDPVTESVLLIHHRKLGKWLQPGGHADGDADTLAVAQREVWEETGLETEPISKAIFDIDIHSIPAKGSEPAHLHYDLRYLLRPNENSLLQPNEEVHAAEWVPIREVALRTNERSVMRMVEKTLTFLEA